MEPGEERVGGVGQERVILRAPTFDQSRSAPGPYRVHADEELTFCAKW